MRTTLSRRRFLHVAGGGPLRRGDARHRAGAACDTAAAEADCSGRIFRRGAGLDRGQCPAGGLVRQPRSSARALRPARISQRAGADLVVPRLRRAVRIAAGRQGRALHLHQRQGKLVHRTHRLSRPRDGGARRCRGRADAGGRRPADRRARWFDSESIALDGAYVYIGLERVNQVLRFDFSKGFARSRGEVVPMPPAVKRLPFNKGAGGAGRGPEGHGARGHADRALRARPRCGGQSGRVPGRRAFARQFSVRRTNSFDISDAVLLPAGDLLVLERKFSLVQGVGIRIRRIPLAAVAPGAVVDGLRSSRPISVRRSTTWKASTPTSRRRATPC